MISKQVVTVTLFRFDGFKNCWWAFTQMGKRAFLNSSSKVVAISAEAARMSLKPSFIKMFGAGSGNGFNLMPDFGVYGLLAVWESDMAARLFFQHNETFKTYQNRAKEIFTVFLQPIMAHGKWDGIEPFENNTTRSSNAPMAVLTRGTVKTPFIFDFLKFTRRTSHSMEGADGRLFSIGIGEVPITQQATFSIWENAEAMKNYAYKNPHHTEVIKKTRELGWYSEELFARFQILDTEGGWKNVNKSYLTDLIKKAQMVAE